MVLCKSQVKSGSIWVNGKDFIHCINHCEKQHVFTSQGGRNVRNWLCNAVLHYSLKACSVSYFCEASVATMLVAGVSRT